MRGTLGERRFKSVPSLRMMIDWMQYARWGLLAVVLFTLIESAAGVIPTAMIKVRKTSKTYYSAPGIIFCFDLLCLINSCSGSFSTSLTSERSTLYRKLVLPTNAADGCDPTAPSLSRQSQFMLLVARGNCSFADKARVREFNFMIVVAIAYVPHSRLLRMLVLAVSLYIILYKACTKTMTTPASWTTTATMARDTCPLRTSPIRCMTWTTR